RHTSAGNLYRTTAIGGVPLNNTDVITAAGAISEPSYRRGRTTFIYYPPASPPEQRDIFFVTYWH
ncbi:MAG: hypothetical protein LUJ25_08550, partial [Firmicutes bacterium]|nr:hypothetical protein [Bacillota bacterium]